MSNDYIDLKKYMSEVLKTCKKNAWKKDWEHGGVYMHLEVSEFIESLRGKGDPVDELGDVLFTVFAVAAHHGLNPIEAIELNREKINGREKSKTN